MRILTVGGGSGGHVTPVRAVINELARLDTNLEVLFVCDKAFEAQSRGLMEHAEAHVVVKRIAAGKLRRYHGVSLSKQLMDLPTVFKNIVDIFKIIGGFFQSLWLIISFKPDVVFAKGGFVCLPMGIAAWLLRKPLVIHDSDARPGLTNQVLSRFATKIATGAPLDNYPYDKSRSKYVGVPINPDFHPFTEDEQREAKAKIGVVDTLRPLIVVTGGGLGSQTINEAIMNSAQDLINLGFEVYHITGKKHHQAVEEAALNHPLYHIVPFVYRDMASVLGAADIVVSRGSATFLQELAALKKPVIVIPAKHLGDQVKNAVVYQEQEAAIVLTDDQISESRVLGRTLIELYDDKKRLQALSERLYKFARPDAALETAEMIVEAYKGSQVGNDVRST